MLLNINVPIDDIDIHINTNKSDDVVVGQWLSLLPNYHSITPISSITTLKPINGDGIKYDIFINERDHVECTILDGVPVENIHDLMESDMNTIEGIKEDLGYINTSDIEREWMVPKLERMEYRFGLLKEVAMLLE